MSYDAVTWGARCSECPLNGNQVIPPTRTPNAKLVIIGDAPERHDVIERQVFAGDIGQLLDRVLHASDFPRNAAHLTNAVLCRTPKNLSPKNWKKAMECCAPRLSLEMRQTKAPTILALGGKALQATTGRTSILDWMGTPLDGKWDKEVFASVSPSYALRDPQWIPVLQIHTNRAVELSRGTLPKWAWPEIVTEKEKYVAALLRLKGASHLGVDVETAGADALHSPLLNVGLASTDLALSISWWEVTPEIRALVAEILANPNIGKDFHNGPYDIVSLGAAGFEVNGYDFDSMAAFAVAAPRLKKGLSIVASILFHAPRWKTEFRVTSDDKGLARFIKADPVERAIYNAKDAYMTAMLREPLLRRLGTIPRGMELFQEQMGLYKIAIKMQRHGLRVDPKAFARHRVVLGKRIVDAKTNLFRLSKRYFLGEIRDSSKGLNNVFINKLGIKPLKWNDSGAPSFDKNVLLKLSTGTNRKAKEVADGILALRAPKKLLSTYVEGLNVTEGRIHASWNPSGAKTGRWSSSDPNLQNQPAIMRDLYIADPGYTLIEVDYQALEARILASLTGDDLLLKWFAEGRDIHTETAKIIFGVSEPTKNQREVAKSCRYAMHYGSSAKTAWEALVKGKGGVAFPDLPLHFVERLFNTFAKLHQPIIAWQIKQLYSAKTFDYIEEPLSGRRYYFYGQVELTKCLNLPNQMGGATLINWDVDRIDKRIDWENEVLLCQVHDSLLGQARDPIPFAMKIKEEMERPVQLNGKSVVFPVDIKMGTSWGKMEKVKLAL